MASPGADTCALLVVLPCVLGGIVPCIVGSCSEKVTWHAMYRTARGLQLLDEPRYVCDEHRTEVARH